MSHQSFSPQDLLGPLNEVEQKNAPKTLYVAGDTGILDVGARVSIVGSRKPGPEGLRRSSKLAALLAVGFTLGVGLLVATLGFMERYRFVLADVTSGAVMVFGPSSRQRAAWPLLTMILPAARPGTRTT